MSRRGFLALASAAAAGSWASGSFAAEPPHWAQVERDWLLSVGYVEGSDEVPSLRSFPLRSRFGALQGMEAADASPPARVVPAAEMILGDQDLALETVEMRVRGLYPGLPPRRLPDAFSSTYLTVYVPSEDPLAPGPLPFLAWGSLRLPGRSLAPPNRFVVPLREDGGLELVLEVRMPRRGGLEVLTGAGHRRSVQPPVVHRFYTDFTVDSHPGRPKLQRGIYLLGLSPELWDSPRELPPAHEPPDHELCSLVVSFTPAPTGEE